MAAQRVGRGLLRKLGLTPARFDLMTALGKRGMRQSDLWRRLNVVRSVISEMLAELLALAWVKRVRAADGRTWLVEMTRRGREVLERAYATCVDNGDATVLMHSGLANGHLECDSQQKRLDFIFACLALEGTFRVAPVFEAEELYGWHPEDYWMWLTDYQDPTGTEKIPFMVPPA